MTLDELMRQKLLAYLREEVDQTAEEVIGYNSRESYCDGGDDGSCIPTTWFEVQFLAPRDFRTGRRRIQTWRFDCDLSQLIARLDFV